MNRYNYRDAITSDVIDYIRDEIDVNDFTDRDALEEHLNNTLWTVDSVTGNASGSYTFNAWEAEENLCHNLDLLQEACNEFCSTPDLDYPESCDVTIRCYLLGECIAKALDQLNELQFAADEDE